MFEEREELTLSPIYFPALVRNRRREKVIVNNLDELMAHVDCDKRISTIRNLLAAKVLPADTFIDPWSLLTEETKHILSLYAKQRRFGMCFLFKDWSECPVGVSIAFDTIATTIETEERKRFTPNGNRTSRTDNQPKDKRLKRS